MPFLKRAELTVKELPWIASIGVAELFDPAAAAFYRRMAAAGFDADRHVKVLPRHKLIYVAVPKAASTRICNTLACIEGRLSRSFCPDKRARYRGPYGPRNTTVGSLYRTATDARAMRFSFVRNPYARLVSCWADKFANRPLVPGDPFIDYYLRETANADLQSRHEESHCLPFADFVRFVAQLEGERRDRHFQAQSTILDIPGIAYTFIGKLEAFDADFACVLDFLRAEEDVRREAARPLNESHRDDWPAYYTPELADCVYRTYERDFDAYGYARALPG